MIYSPLLPFTYINQFLTPVTTERYILLQHIIVVKWCKSGGDYTDVYGWRYSWKEVRMVQKQDKI